MSYKVLIRSEIEPYYTIIPMIEERAEIVRWNPLDPQPPAELLRTIEGVYNYGHYAFTAEYMDLMPEAPASSATTESASITSTSKPPKSAASP